MQRPSQGDDGRPPSPELLSWAAEGKQNEEEEASVDEKAESVAKGSTGNTLTEASETKRAIGTRSGSDKLRSASSTVDKKLKARAADETSPEKEQETAARKRAKPSYSSRTESSGQASGRMMGNRDQGSGESASLDKDVKQSISGSKSSDQVDSLSANNVNTTSQGDEGASQNNIEAPLEDEATSQGHETASQNNIEAPLEDKASLLYTDNIMAAAAATNDELEAAASLEEEAMLSSRSFSNAVSKRLSEPKSLPISDTASTASTAALVQQLMAENEELRQRNAALQQEVNSTKQLLLQVLTRLNLNPPPSIQQQRLDTLTMARQIDFLRNSSPSASSSKIGTLLQLQPASSIGREALLSLLAQQQLPSQPAIQATTLAQLLQQRLQLQSSPLFSQNLGASRLQHSQLQRELLFPHGSQQQPPLSVSPSPNLDALLAVAAAQEASLRQPQGQQQGATDASSQQQESKQGQESAEQPAKSSGSGATNRRRR